MKEFDLISSFFTHQATTRKDVKIGIGDDAAVLNVPEGKQLVVTTDTLVAGVHFPLGTEAKAIGHKAIAVNLSDLAAMGAEPSWVSLAITLPEVDEHWLAEFAGGLFELCEYYHVQLIGGDVTQGPMSITVSAHGLVPKDKAMLRTGAQGGDLIYVTGQLGDAALALSAILGQGSVSETDIKTVSQKLNYPVPRVLAGQTLRDFASAAIDISDGLLADLSHICQKSAVGAQIIADNLPLSNELGRNRDREQAITLALTGGDDYELLFTVPQEKKGGMETALAHAGVTVTQIGQIKANGGISVSLDGAPFQVKQSGFIHFNS